MGVVINHVPCDLSDATVLGHSCMSTSAGVRPRSRGKTGVVLAFEERVVGIWMIQVTMTDRQTGDF
jgi:hypothetical protein